MVIVNKMLLVNKCLLFCFFSYLIFSFLVLLCGFYMLCFFFNSKIGKKLTTTFFNLLK